MPITLRDYQKRISDDGVQILNTFRCLYLAMEVRTGKTITALSIADKWGASKVLFCTKKKAISSIQHDFNISGYEYHIDITNYENMHNIKPEYDFYILDEAHCLGAFPKPSLRTQQLKLMVKDNPVIFLSGTPTPESYSQIYHQLYVSSNSPFNTWSNFYKWAKDFVTLKHKFLYGRQINDYSQVSETGQVFIDTLKQSMFLSYSQKQSGFKQEVQEKFFTVKMDAKTYNLANKLKKDRVVETGKGTILADTEVKLMNKLHQIYSGTVKFEDGNSLFFDRSKAQFIFNKFFRFGKLAIYYKFIEEGNLLREMFPCNTTIPEDFNSDRTNDLVFLSQIQSGREGINLSTADFLVMYNIDYSAVSYFQSRARMQSKDRIKEAFVYWIFAEDSLDQRIYQMVKQKKNFTLSHFKKCL